MCGAALLKGGFYIGKHEGDTLHMLEIVMRMAEGQWPHLDFMTPIGVLAFAPIALFLKLGFPVGKSIFLAQGLVALVFLPAVWWVSYSRLRGFAAYLFGLFVLVLITALVAGEAQRSVSISMSYNRWSWAAAFVAITLAVVPARGRARPLADGVIIGLAMAALALMKMTYFASFLVPVVVAMALRGSFRAMFWALVAGLSVAAVITLSAGFEYWAAYLKDLLTVAASDIRPNPGEPFGAVLGAPAYLGASLALIAGVILLRQAGEAVGGLVLLLLTLGFFYVTYQNYGNDPQWLLLLGVLLIAFLPRLEIRNGLGWDMRTALKVNAAIALAFAAPSFFNLAYSPFRHLNTDVADYSPLVPGNPRTADLFAANTRIARLDAKIPLPGDMPGREVYDELAEREPPTVFNGEELPDCSLDKGMAAWFSLTVKDLEQAGLAQGRRVFAADLLSSEWLFGSFEPLVGGAPWYYGGLPGIESADYLLVPLCPIIPKSRDIILKNIEDAGLAFAEIRRTPFYILYEPAAPSGAEKSAGDQVEGQ
jgi:hypothetical protein